MKYLHMGAFILLAIGGLNWLLYAFNFNLVEMIFGTSFISMLLYILIGLSAVFEVVTHKKNCRMCAVSGVSQPSSMGGTL